MENYLPHLESLSGEAMQQGAAIDLSGCYYGETSGCCRFKNWASDYYVFLAGLVRLLRLTRILEVGTHCGGSIMSMSKGLYVDDLPTSKLLTIDITYKNESGFSKYPHIKRIHGDALEPTVVQEAAAYFNGDIDLLFIDSLHEYQHTQRVIELYAPQLNPRFIVLDDIRQCQSMRELWRDLEKRYPGRACDLSEISKRRGAGFGLVAWRTPFVCAAPSRQKD